MDSMNVRFGKIGYTYRKGTRNVDRVDAGLILPADMLRALGCERKRELYLTGDDRKAWRATESVAVLKAHANHHLTDPRQAQHILTNVLPQIGERFKQLQADVANFIETAPITLSVSKND